MKTFLLIFSLICISLLAAETQIDFVVLVISNTTENKRLIISFTVTDQHLTQKQGDTTKSVDLNKK